MGVMDEVYITFSESDVIDFPLKLLCWPLVQTVDIGKWPILCLSGVMVSCPTHLLREMRSAEDRPDLAWGLYFRFAILWPCHSVVDVILEVLTTNELLYLILEGDALLSGVTDIFMEPTVIVMVPFRAVST